MATPQTKQDIQRRVAERKRAASRGGELIEFTKLTVIGSIVTDPDGTQDVMTAFFTAVERDARDDMNPHGESVNEYGMTDDLGTTKVTVEHKPHQR